MRLARCDRNGRCNLLEYDDVPIIWEVIASKGLAPPASKSIWPQLVHYKSG